MGGVSRSGALLGRCTTVISIVLFSTAISAYADGFDQVRDFNIEEQALDTALIEFSEQAGVQLMVPTELVAGLRSPSIAGQYASDNALAALLDGSELTFQTIGDDTVTLSKVGERATPGKKPPTSNSILMAQASVEQNRRARTDTVEVKNKEVEEADFQIEEIIVTGTNIRGLENPTTPVLQFDRADIEFSGAATVEDFLRTIPQNFNSETQLSTDSGNPFDTNLNSLQGSFINLRGLGAGSTLTLLNGRRMTSSGSGSLVDTSVLPLGAIDRVDILTDGASAIYGSDAVGGVVNFITRQDYEGFEINGRYGTVTDGSKEDFSVGAAGGLNWRSGAGFLAVNYLEETPLLNSERGFVDQTVVTEGGTFGSNTDRFAASGSINQQFGRRVRFFSDFLYSSREAEASDNTLSFPIINRSEQQALFINSRAEYSLSGDVTATLFFDYGQNRIDNGQSDDNFEETISQDNDLLVIEAHLSGSLFELLSGIASFALGALHREEDLVFAVDDIAAVDAGRSVDAAYAEILVPLVREGSIPFFQQLELSAAGRYENFSDFGDTFDPKIGLYWGLNDQFSLRGSYSESFRAPSLSELNLLPRYTINAFPSFGFTAVTPPQPDDGFVITMFSGGGNPNLRPETAETWSAGFTYVPSFFAGLSLEGNYFDISYKNRIESIDIITPIQTPQFVGFADIPPNLAEVEAIFADDEAGRADIAFFVPARPEDIEALLRTGTQNVSERDVSGVDVNLKYQTDTRHGRFSAGVNASYLIDYVARSTEIADPVEQINTLYRPIDLKLRGNLSWSQGGFTAFVAVNYTDGYRDNPNPSNANDIASWTTIDLSLAYDSGQTFANSALLNNVRMGLGIRNVSDEDPPFAATLDGFNFDPANADPFGRMISFTIAKQF